MLEPLVRGARLVTLAGPGGIGKTRLALALMERLDSAFEGRLWMVELAALAEPEDVILSVATALGLPSDGGQPLEGALIERIGAEPGLLVLDNCEHLVDACACLAELLLQGCPRLHILATSRQSLGVPGEHAWRVPSLKLVNETEPPAMVREAEAVRLLVERAQSTHSGFVLRDANTAAAARVCRQLDGIPLAIELAAARLSVLSLEQLADRLGSHLHVLGGAGRTVPWRQRTLEATLDWSYELLEESERMLFRRLAVFAGDFLLDAVESVCGAADDTLELLARLTDKSLIQVDAYGAAARYRLLEPIREYAAARLAETDEELDLRRRHRDWYMAFVGHIARSWRTEQRADLLDCLERELDNVRAAVRFCIQQDEAEPGLALVDALWFFWNVRGHVGEWLHVLDLLLALPSAANIPAVRARALNATGYLALAQGDEARARRCHEEALAIARALDDCTTMIHSLRRLGVVRRLVGDIDGARSALEESLALARQIGDSTSAYLALYVLADTSRFTGELKQAIDSYRESLVLMRAAGDDWHSAQVLLGMSYAMALLDDFASAEHALRESLDALHGLGDRRMLAACIEGFAFVASRMNAFERAAYLFGGASAVRQAVQSAPDALLRAESSRALASVEAHLGSLAFAKCVEAGRQQAPEVIIKMALETAAQRHGGAPEASRFGLTPRESEVLRLLARGMSNRAIAGQLVISEQTAETHVKRILNKLGVSSRTEAAARALELGFAESSTH